MAVAMASGSLAAGAHTLCRSNEIPFSAKAVFGFSARKLCILPRQKYVPFFNIVFDLFRIIIFSL